MQEKTSAHADGSVMRDIKTETLPLHSRTPVHWARDVLEDPVVLLVDHACPGEEGRAETPCSFWNAGRRSGCPAG